MPALPPPECTGVSTTLQDIPRSVDRNTRALDAPPEAIHTVERPDSAIEVPLAAKAASPSSIGGSPAWSSFCQVAPPSLVRKSVHLPAVGSLRTMPFERSQ